ncbi:MAG: nicotinamide-nucleotide amidohydrolase family protein [Caldimicrobium thiodismutans]
MKGALLFIGDELIAGKIHNTNAEFAGKIFSALTLKIQEILTIPDDEEVIVETLRRLIDKYDFIITSGGLGPTEDDLTIKALAKALSLTLEEDKTLLSAILSSKEYQGKEEMAKKMSLLPTGAHILDDEYRMLGFYIPLEKKKLFFLPGVPEQFEYLLEKKVVPLLCEAIDEKRVCKEDKIFKNFIFFDLNETDLNLFITELSEKEDVKIGYYPIFPEVKLVLFGEKNKVENLSQRIIETFRLNLVSEGEESLEIVIGKLLLKGGFTLSTAESCTGGLLASLITSVSGSSAYFERGFVTYSPESKREILGVSSKTLETKGIYSHETAQEMALGAKKRSQTDFSLSTTGIAGPTGDSSGLPVGTVFIGLATPKEVLSFHFQFFGDRNTIQKLASYTALDILRRYILYGKGFFSYRFAKGFKERTL